MRYIKFCSSFPKNLELPWRELCKAINIYWHYPRKFQSCTLFSITWEARLKAPLYLFKLPLNHKWIKYILWLNSLIPDCHNCPQVNGNIFWVSPSAFLVSCLLFCLAIISTIAFFFRFVAFAFSKLCIPAFIAMFQYYLFCLCGSFRSPFLSAALKVAPRSYFFCCILKQFLNQWSEWCFSRVTCHSRPWYLHNAAVAAWGQTS